MKNVFTKIALLTLVFSGGLTAVASTGWTSHGVQREKAFDVPTRASADIQIGHCSTNDVIWPYDGLSLDHDARVGVGAMITKDMYEKYVGGKVVGMWVGWDDEASESTYECFVRKDNFVSDDISTGSGDVAFGWNYIEMTPFEIDSDVESLAVGFYTDLQKNVCSIPKIYPMNVENSCFLWSGETDESGKEQWYDMHTMENFGIMPVVLVIEDAEGKFHNMISINTINHDVVVSKNTPTEAVFNISNVGSNDISSIEVTSKFGDESHSEVVEFESAMPAQGGGKVVLPVTALGSGIHKVSITSINGETPKYSNEYDVELIGVAQDVADKYVYRPLVEYFVSEDDYASVSYVEEILIPGIEPYLDDMTLIMPHLEDKFMTGDDDALNQLILFGGGDKMKVFVPSMTISRSEHYIVAAYNSNIYGTPMMYTFYPDFATIVYDNILTYPTFASVDVNATMDDNGAITVKAFGTVEEDVMPEGEDLYLSVYLMEKNVYTEDQRFWDDKEAETQNGEYIHRNVIRELLSPLWGEKLEKTGGDYSMTFNTQYYEEWNKDNLYVVAFLNRGKDNHHMSLQVINSVENEFKHNSIESTELTKDVEVTVNGNSVNVVGTNDFEVYDLTGVKVGSDNLSAGIYIVKASANGSVVTEKIIVK